MKLFTAVVLGFVLITGVSVRANSAEGAKTSSVKSVEKSVVKSSVVKSVDTPSCTVGENPSLAKSAYDFAVVDVEGKPAKLSTYKGQVALIVNTASKCGYTGQYRDLQALFEKYKSKGFVVLGFPSNDFGGQEPGSNKEIKTFCETNFNVKFPLFDKGAVIGASKQPLYKFLTEESGEPFKGEIAWNFEKFLVDKDGHVVGRYKSRVKPLDGSLTKVLEANLAKPASCI